MTDLNILELEWIVTLVFQGLQNLIAHPLHLQLHTDFIHCTVSKLGYNHRQHVLSLHSLCVRALHTMYCMSYYACMHVHVLCMQTQRLQSMYKLSANMSSIVVGCLAKTIASM